MYCPSCANPVKKGLKYCNHCGEKLAKDDDKLSTPGALLDGLLETLFWIVIPALGILVGLVAVMLNYNLRQEALTVIVVAYLFALLAICFPIIRQITKLIDARVKGVTWDDNEPERPQLEPRTTAQLDEYREPVMSVTDHTTRTLDKVPQKKG